MYDQLMKESKTSKKKGKGHKRAQFRSAQLAALSAGKNNLEFLYKEHEDLISKKNDVELRRNKLLGSRSKVSRGINSLCWWS